MNAALLILDGFITVTLVSISHVQRQTLHKALNNLILLLFVHGLFQLADNSGAAIAFVDNLFNVILNLFLNENSLAQRFVV